MTIAKRIGDRIRERREELGLTQAGAARRLPGNVEGTQWSKWERGINRPHDRHLEQIALALESDVSDFMIKEPPPARAPDPFPAADPTDHEEWAAAMATWRRHCAQLLAIQARAYRAWHDDDTPTMQALESAVITLQVEQADRVPAEHAAASSSR